MSTFQESNYYKSKEHLDNIKNAGIKGNLKIQELKEKRIEEYYKNPKLCKECGEPIAYEKKNEKIFCNSSCATKFNNRNRDKSFITEDFKNKIRCKLAIFNEIKLKPIKNYDFDTICSVCGKPLTLKQLTKKKINVEKRGDTKKTYCSIDCKTQCVEYRQKISLKAKERIANGAHKGWASRKITSYPEKFFMNVLDNNGIKYFHNHVVKKRDLGLNDNSNYFLDFYVEELKLDIEIDGKQHKYKDREISDTLRDSLLNENGIKVYRIEWKNPKTSENSEYLKKEIDEFVIFFNKLKNGV